MKKALVTVTLIAVSIVSFYIALFILGATAVHCAMSLGCNSGAYNMLITFFVVLVLFYGIIYVITIKTLKINKSYILKVLIPIAIAPYILFSVYSYGRNTISGINDAIKSREKIYQEKLYLQGNIENIIVGTTSIDVIEDAEEYTVELSVPIEFPIDMHRKDLTNFQGNNDLIVYPRPLDLYEGSCFIYDMDMEYSCYFDENGTTPELCLEHLLYCSSKERGNENLCKVEILKKGKKVYKYKYSHSKYYCTPEDFEKLKSLNPEDMTIEIRTFDEYTKKPSLFRLVF